MERRWGQPTVSRAEMSDDEEYVSEGYAVAAENVGGLENTIRARRQSWSYPCSDGPAASRPRNGPA